MRTFWILTVLGALPAFAAGDARFNGRWDITGYSKPHPRAWWLEINGAETATPGGKFVTAYAGDMNEIRQFRPPCSFPYSGKFLMCSGQ